MQSRLRSVAALFLIGALYWIGASALVGDSPFSDLRSVWLAGQFYPQGDPALVYRMSPGLFTMEPPGPWLTATIAEGIETPVYPFVYPPLWAALMAKFSALVSWEGFALAASFLNKLMVAGMFVLAWRIARPGIGLSAFLAIALVPVFLSLSFVLPMQENQPQILVSFLILLAIERQRSDAPMSGGAALALAASIKLYPAVFALLWLASGERRATAAFAATGAALAAASVGLAGWEMHAAFLGELQAISSSVLLSLANFSFSPLIAAVALPETAMVKVTTEATGGGAAWLVGAKPALWKAGETALQIGTLAALTVLAFRTKMRAPLLWPAAIIAVAWVSPLSWLYHYMTAFAFLPALIGRLGLARALLLMAACLLPTSLPYAMLTAGGTVSPVNTVLLANAGILVLGAVFFLLATERQTAWDGSPEPLPD